MIVQTFPYIILTYTGQKAGAVMKVTIIEGEYSDKARIACYDYIIMKYIKERIGKCVEDEGEKNTDPSIEIIEDSKLASEIEDCNTP
mgnify:CR=1 FL=1